MTLVEVCNILDLNNIFYESNGNIIQEEHGINEDYYELRNLQNKGYIYYCIREKNTEDIKIFEADIEDINKKFLLILLAKNELKHSREMRNELIRTTENINTIVNLKKQIEKYNITTKFSIGEDKNVTVNVVVKGNKYLLIVNKDRITVYSEMVETFLKLKIRLLFLLLKNDYIKKVVDKGYYEGYTLQLEVRDYEYFFHCLELNNL